MSSTHVLRRPGDEAGPAAPQVSELLVMWQHPETMAILPIGRFGYDGELYTFNYTRQAAEIQGLRPLPELRDLHRTYRSAQMPLVFEQRVMSPRRPDFDDYLSRIGLLPENATPWEQIVHSGGTRVGDTLQFMQMPEVRNGRAHARFFANGIRHVPEMPRDVGGRVIKVTRDSQEAALCALNPGDLVELQPEHGNRIDARACLIVADGTPVGWVPMAISSDVRRLMSPEDLSARVARIAPASSPAHTRLVVDLDVPAPEGFAFDPEGMWDPLAG
ncbi:hypothetical protein [Acidipropionibacterium virtanenii]|uniref:HIRAN domain-containing protein n=1 Tax=Acidipropionibacterium virtanenii TaxID=2057246 RepID=A0A344UXG1_9ACTN|nr:hypothetical protein [Acidipropionibacterium virtanenii]AXE39959.1 hypothetical protein JS278_02824 [Acidipropionibacterium virtanenii]